MCGTPVALSRVIVTSERGVVLLSTCPAGTPNDESLKNWLILSLVSAR
jgi:hypothetical protein